jgi:hypothetical protein
MLYQVQILQILCQTGLPVWCRLLSFQNTKKCTEIVQY